MTPPGDPKTRTPKRSLPTRHRHRIARRDAGLSLVEVLVALAVLGLATTGLLHLHAELSSSTAQWRETARALQALRSQVEARRADPTGPPSATTPIASTPGAPLVDASGLAGSIVAHATGQGVTGELQLASQWTDRLGADRRLTMSMQWPLPDVELADLADASRPGRWPAPVPAAAALRHPAVPREARDLDGDTAFAPGTVPGLAGWIVDRRTGEVRAACATPPAPVGTAGGLADGLPDGCEPLAGRLMTGTLRFSLGAAPSLRGPFDDPLPLALVLRQADGRIAWPGCEATEVRGDDAHLAWRCFVPAPTADAPPPARPTLMPHGWSIAGDAATHRVCWTRETITRAAWRGPANAWVVRAALPCPAGTLEEPVLHG